MKISQIITLSILLIASLALPYVASANHAPIKSNVFVITILGGPLVVCTGSPGAATANLPTCTNLCDFIAQIANVIYFAIAVVIWIITPILVSYAGIRYMLAGANPEAIGEAKKIITGAVWAIAIVLCAYLIVSVFVSVIGIQGVGGFGKALCGSGSGSSGSSAIPMNPVNCTGYNC